MAEKTCGECRWWKLPPTAEPSLWKNWGVCYSHLTTRRTATADSMCRDRGCIQTHKNFGCIHFQPKEERKP